MRTLNNNKSKNQPCELNHHIDKKAKTLHAILTLAPITNEPNTVERTTHYSVQRHGIPMGYDNILHEAILHVKVRVVVLEAHSCVDK